MKLNLYTFPICPFGQSSLILLKYLNLDYQVNYINLENKPEWFDDASPLWKVPLLEADGNFLFESIVINEFLNDFSNSDLLPSDSVDRAFHLSYLVFANELILKMSSIFFAKSQGAYDLSKNEFFDKISHFESLIDDSWYFSKKFSLVDIAFLVLFHRLSLFTDLNNEFEKRSFKKIIAWKHNLLNMNLIEDSLQSNFKEMFFWFLDSKDSFIMKNK